LIEVTPCKSCKLERAALGSSFVNIFIAQLRIAFDSFYRIMTVLGYVLLEKVDLRLLSIKAACVYND
jgi:hypothetical protein